MKGSVGAALYGPSSMEQFVPNVKLENSHMFMICLCFYITFTLCVSQENRVTTIETTGLSYIPQSKDEIGSLCALISITSPCNEHPLTPHFYIEKVGFTRVYIFFLILLQNIDCGYSLEPPR